MAMVLEDNCDLENGDLEETFQICFKELEKKVCDGIIPDIIFPNVNLLRSKKADVDARYIKHLGDLLRNPEYSQEDVYHEMNWTCMFCYKTTLVQGMLPMEYHAAEKHHLVILGKKQIRYQYLFLKIKIYTIKVCTSFVHQGFIQFHSRQYESCYD